jgi:uncharacterized DUF497 family protein
MLAMEYEWDPQKAAQNLRKHKVDFADTRSSRMRWL